MARPGEPCIRCVCGAAVLSAGDAVANCKVNWFALGFEADLCAEAGACADAIVTVRHCLPLLSMVSHCHQQLCKIREIYVLFTGISQ